jgi:hypothetical protein
VARARLRASAAVARSTSTVTSSSVDRDRRAGQLLPVGDGAAQDVQHRQVALRAGHLVRVDCVGDEAVPQPARGW